ncbi:SH3 domain-containing protein [Pseudoruegeria sp. HB172150]|uniref:SH3 domain-containing protein n=1 Tax=Pseudoruegeria sp. HB172150 TaxID=2721164 RepID=UPI001555276C|nr:SH3 domain-containing protein [Pseudoruegeria sp. HB172150]
MRATAATALAFAAMVSGISPGHAGTGASTTYLNVRAAAGGGNAVVGGLAPGDVVEILRCDADGWCLVAGAGQEGWVASRYLTAGPEYPQANPACSWNLNVALPEPRFEATCPPGVEPPPPPPPPGDIACFFTEPSFGGDRTCLDVGDYARLDASEQDVFSSVQLSGEARVRLCTEPDLGGICMDWLASATELDRRLDDAASSVKVYVGYLPPPPPPPPVIHSEGTLSVTRNGRVNLDAGTASAAGADLWWRAVDGGAQVLQVVNGAQLSLGDGSDRSLQACSSESYDETPLRLSDLEGGSVVCIKTNLGRVGRVQVTETGGGIEIAYVTWGEE